MAVSSGGAARSPAALPARDPTDPQSFDGWGAELMAFARRARCEAPGSDAVRAAALSPLAGFDSTHRLLLGRGPAGAEARLSIDAGPLAGTLIHLREGARGIDAAVCAPVASSRQTLMAAMDEVALRLKQKGHTLKVQVQAGGKDADRADQTER